MMHLYLLFQFLLAHWIADFVMQTHWMAVNKSKNWRALASHVVVYTVTLGIALSVLGLAIGSFTPSPGAVVMLVSFDLFLVWLALNGALHFVTDAITSRITARLWVKGDFHNFFVVVGLDQLIHYTTLILTWVLIATYFG
jgi:Protein of unknown function (DUF3307)